MDILPNVPGGDITRSTELDPTRSCAMSSRAVKRCDNLCDYKSIGYHPGANSGAETEFVDDRNAARLAIGKVSHLYNWPLGPHGTELDYLVPVSSRLRDAQALLR